MAIPDEIPQGSKEYMSVVLESDSDLTLATVELGLSDETNVQPASWLPGTWPDPGTNIARTVAPVDTANLALGFYKVWVRITDSPEILPRSYGTVRIV